MSFREISIQKNLKKKVNEKHFAKQNHQTIKQNYDIHQKNQIEVNRFLRVSIKKLTKRLTCGSCPSSGLIKGAR